MLPLVVVLLNKSNFAGLPIRSLIILINPGIPWQSKSSELPTGRPTTGRLLTVVTHFPAGRIGYAGLV